MKDYQLCCQQSPSWQKDVKESNLDDRTRMDKLKFPKEFFRKVADVSKTEKKCPKSNS